MNLGTNLAIPEHSLHVGGAIKEAEPMFTFKTLATRASAACLLLGLSVAPLFSQAAAEQKQPQARTKAENDAYMLLYNEADRVKKVELATRFLADYPETEFKLTVNLHLETGEKFIRDFPQAEQ
jgi:hypothetical protein